AGVGQDIVEQGRLADAGLAPHDDGRARPIAGGRDPRLQRRALVLPDLQRPIRIRRTRHVPPTLPQARAKSVPPAIEPVPASKTGHPTRHRTGATRPPGPHGGGGDVTWRRRTPMSLTLPNPAPSMGAEAIR